MGRTRSQRDRFLVLLGPLRAAQPQGKWLFVSKPVSLLYNENDDKSFPLPPGEMESEKPWPT